MPTPTRPAATDDIEDRDPGLAQERTDLAWTRTAISFIALGTGMLHASTIAGALVVAAGAAVWVLGHLSARSARGANHHPERRRIVRLVTAATTLTAAIALASTLLAAGHG
ncbi:DUF202 domain-containing protein [Actinoplanes sp. NPDC049316]|uniref:DUF202 domain-containing protein n=1 Tax=Actinoplanes sp. NPDC049316 TaxID=3154727 RepID=UPI00341297C2